MKTTEITTSRLPFAGGGLLSDLFKNEFDSFFGLSHKATTYPYDLYENKDSVTLEIPLAGYNKEDISVNVQNDILNISVKKKEVSESKYLYNKIKRSGLSLSLFLGGVVNVDAVDASLDNGLLKIVMPKQETAKPKEIVIK